MKISNRFILQAVQIYEEICQHLNKGKKLLAKICSKRDSQPYFVVVYKPVKPEFLSQYKFLLRYLVRYFL
jgi:hypothetical protein